MVLNRFTNAARVSNYLPSKDAFSPGWEVSLSRTAGSGSASRFFAPHPPLNPPQRFLDLYDPSTLPLPIMNEGEEKQLNISPAEWQRIKAYYYALVSHMDDQIGRLIKALQDLHLIDNTIIIFTSDHGDHLGDHGLFAKGLPGYDSCTHVPLIISYPDA